MSPPIGIPPALLALLKVEDQTAPLWIVGGAVRDLLLQRKSHDYDFVTSKEAIALARRVANSLDADIYVLDEERDAARVLYINQDAQHYTFDFARLRGESISFDLQARDFTINAMAFRISSMEDLIDPCGGLQHLHAGLLELCHEDALHNDPIRALRAIRIATELGFQLSTGTVSALGSLPTFEVISSERMRDELFNILTLEDPTAALQLLRHFRLLSRVFPIPDELGIKPDQRDPSHFLERSIRNLATVLRLLSDQPDLDVAAEATLGLLTWTLGRYRVPLTQYFKEEVTYSRHRRALLFLSSLFYAFHRIARINSEVDDISQSTFEALILWLADHLRLSKDEVVWLQRWVLGLQWLEAESEEDKWDDVDRYRYFRAVGDTGIASVLSILAFELAGQIEPPDQEHWAHQLEMARLILEAWFEKFESIVDPKPVISGEDVMGIFDERPGPMIGEMLEEVREAQVGRKITNREQALAYLRKRVKPKQKE